MVLILMQHFRLAKSIVFSKFAVVVGCLNELFFTDSRSWKPAFW